MWAARIHSKRLSSALSWSSWSSASFWIPFTMWSWRWIIAPNIPRYLLLEAHDRPFGGLVLLSTELSIWWSTVSTLSSSPKTVLGVTKVLPGLEDPANDFVRVDFAAFWHILQLIMDGFLLKETFDSVFTRCSKRWPKIMFFSLFKVLTEGRALSLPRLVSGSFLLSDVIPRIFPSRWLT